MSTTLTLFRKELRSYFSTPFGWVILTFVLVLQGVSLSYTLKLFRDTPQKEGLLFTILHAPVFWFYFLFIFPLLTMKTFAEEEKTGTLETLLTAPVKTGQVVIAKYLASYTFYIFLWLPLLLYPFISDGANALASAVQHTQSSMFITYPLQDIVGCYSILLLMGSWFTALGVLASSLTSSQIISGIITVGLLVLTFFMGIVPIVWGEFPASSAFHYVSSMEHMDTFTQGLIDSRPIVFYISATILTLAITARIVDHRRWTH